MKKTAAVGNEDAVVPPTEQQPLIIYMNDIAEPWPNWYMLSSSLYLPLCQNIEII